MIFADHSQEAGGRIYEALVEIVDSPFMLNGGEVLTCRSFRWPSCRSQVSVIRYA